MAEATVAGGTLVAAALNLLDVAITNDQFLFRRLQPLRRRLGGGRAVRRRTRRYLTGPPAPYGTLADLVPVPDAAAFRVQPGLGPRPRRRPRGGRDARLCGSRLPVTRTSLAGLRGWATPA